MRSAKLGKRINFPEFIQGFWKHFIIIAICISIIFPLYFMVITAFKTQEQYLFQTWAITFPPIFSNFSEAFKGKFINWFKNTAILTFASAFLSTFLASLIAFAIVKLKFRGKEALLTPIVSLMAVPPAVIIIPIFVLFARVELINNYLGVIIIYVGMMIPFSVFMLTNFFRAVPKEITESAVIDGCSTFQLYRLIFLRLSVPALMTNVIIHAVWAWNELFVVMILMQSDEMKTISLGLAYFKTRYTVNIPVMMAGTLISIIPMVALYLFCQNFLIKGLTVGYSK